MGLIGAMIAFGVANRSAIGRAIRNTYGRWVVYIIAFGLIPGLNVDNWAHIGGLAAGFVDWLCRRYAGALDSGAGRDVAVACRPLRSAHVLELLSGLSKFSFA